MEAGPKNAGLALPSTQCMLREDQSQIPGLTPTRQAPEWVALGKL